MLPVFVRIIGSVGIPGAGEQVCLPGHGATLHVHAVDEAVFNIGSAPIAAPDQAAAVCQLAQEREVTFPTGLSTNDADNVTRQAVVMNPHSSQLGGALVEEFLLAGLAAIGFVDHEFDFPWRWRQRLCPRQVGVWLVPAGKGR